MKSDEVRKTFFEFFKSKGHRIVSSAPLVVKDDPSLMFINAGMNQFKDIFLGDSTAKFPRVANSQKCLRVSGKHNDIEEVGHDTYHHTMFEMLGNWSFGNYSDPSRAYFKKEAIEYAWQLLTKKYKINKNDLYSTVYEGNKQDNIPPDKEAYDYWNNLIPCERILYGGKKDNFWEMGEAGPCGPCSEIHVDLRSEEEKKEIPGYKLINKDHPEVIEIWNLVFIEYNRNSEGKLSKLPARHVDTGMGFERLCMILQEKKSNYDTDLFQPLIKEIGKLTGKAYGENSKTDVAIRVVADHLRAVTFAISDGQLPSNTGAGYVIRRVLRRAVRYGYTFLDMKEPFINELVPIIAEQMKAVYPELKSQQKLSCNVIKEEEISFQRTLSQGIRKFDQYTSYSKNDNIIDGDFAFELFDTYGFPIDLTQLMAKEKGWAVDMDGFKKGLKQQKERSREAAEVDAEDWIVVHDAIGKTEFIGYDELKVKTRIKKYRKVRSKKKSYYEIVLEKTPFYAESGGQVGDKGFLNNGHETINIFNTIKSHESIIHLSDKIFTDVKEPIVAVVDGEKRKLTANNHSATHLLHSALKKVLGDHVEQKGSLVEPDRLRFDFSHFSRLTEYEISKIEEIVNEKIRENIPIAEKRNIPVNEALKMGAVALFGEKYDDLVRVISFDDDFSIELCGGTHVNATGQIGFFKIVSESAIASGIRRIEAITAKKAEEYVNKTIKITKEIKELLKNPKDLKQGVLRLIEDNNNLQKELNSFKREKVNVLRQELKRQIEKIGNINFIAQKVDIDMAGAKDLAYNLNSEISNLFIIIANSNKGKVNLTMMISENLVKQNKYNAGQIILEVAKEINGGGGGQPHFSTAGGKNPEGIKKAFDKARQIIKSSK